MANPPSRTEVVNALTVALERSLQEEEQSERYWNNFVDYVEEVDPRMTDERAITDPDLFGLYNFAAFHFYLSEHDSKIDHKEVVMGRQILKDALPKLKVGEIMKFFEQFHESV